MFEGYLWNAAHHWIMTYYCSLVFGPLQSKLTWSSYALTFPQGEVTEYEATDEAAFVWKKDGSVVASDVAYGGVVDQLLSLGQKVDESGKVLRNPSGPTRLPNCKFLVQNEGYPKVLDWRKANDKDKKLSVIDTWLEVVG